MDPAEKRIVDILRILKKEYPRSRSALRFENPLQILVATILSAQCTDERVNQVTPALFKKYPAVTDFARADQNELQEEIRSTGFFRNKSNSIILSAQKIVKNFGGRVPDSMAELITLPGVARKTANIVLSNGFGKAEGIAVDTHVKRISRKLGLSREVNPDKIERDLLAIVPNADWLDFNNMLVNFGRRICQARKPKCLQCGLRSFCPSALEASPLDCDTGHG